MGTYTELVVIARIKEEFQEDINTIFSSEEKSWEILDIDREILDSFIQCERYSCIPFMDCDVYLKPRFENRIMMIYCDIKNYDKEIEKFYEVVKIISQEIICYRSRHEGWSLEDTIDWIDYR